MFLFTPDGQRGVSLAHAIRGTLGELTSTVKEAMQRKPLLRFLLARMVYQDGVNGLLALGGTFAASMFGWQTIEMGIYGMDHDFSSHRDFTRIFPWKSFEIFCGFNFRCSKRWSADI